MDIFTIVIEDKDRKGGVDMSVLESRKCLVAISELMKVG